MNEILAESKASLEMEASFPVMGDSMRGLVQFWAIFRKEFKLQYGSRVVLLNRLLVGPLINVFTTGILYRSVFVHNPNMQLATLSQQSYLTFIVFGFLSHTFMNSGYYVFSGKLLMESRWHTLPLFWLAPCRKSVLVLGLYSAEGLRCLAIIALCTVFLPPSAEGAITTLVVMLPLIACLIAFSIGMGLLRSGLTLLNGDRAELIDNCYIFFVFTACPYIPETLLPGVLRPLCEVNPIFHLANAMRSVWAGNSPYQSMIPFLVGLIVLWTVLYLGWRRFSPLIIARSL